MMVVGALGTRGTRCAVPRRGEENSAGFGFLSLGWTGLDWTLAAFSALLLLRENEERNDLQLCVTYYCATKL